MDTLPQQLRSTAIQKIVRDRGITQLVHFTTLQNLFGIVEMDGLIARDNLIQIAAQRKDQYLLDYIAFNDSVRLDMHTGHINLSIQHPNPLLFRRFRQRFAQCDVWCVLLIAPECMTIPGTLFTLGNAASRHVRSAGIGSNSADLEAMFGDTILTGNQYEQRTLTRKELAPCYPTDPQAEVMIPSRVPLAKIFAMAFDCETSSLRARAALKVRDPNAQIPESKIIPELFKERPIGHG